MIPKNVVSYLETNTPILFIKLIIVDLQFHFQIVSFKEYIVCIV